MLFDKDGFYMVSPTVDYDFVLDIIPSDTNPKLYSPTEGLRRGNMFPALYKPYKNYEPGNLRTSSEREKKLLEIQKLDFAINDLNLYLDMHPEDTDAYKLFSKYVEDCRIMKEEYKNIYGPIMLDNLTDKYEWSKSTWPWEGSGI